MFRLGARLLSQATANKVKTTTGLVNFPVVTDFKSVLMPLYSETLEKLAKFPADVRQVALDDAAGAHYRQCVISDANPDTSC